MFCRNGIIGKANNTIKDGERISHGAVCLLCNELKGFFLGLNPFSFGDFLQIVFCIRYANAFKIKNLTARKYGGDYFVFFGCSKYKNGMGRRFFQRF